MDVNNMLNLLYAHKGKKTDKEFIDSLRKMIIDIRLWSKNKFGEDLV